MLDLIRAVVFFCPRRYPVAVGLPDEASASNGRTLIQQRRLADQPLCSRRPWNTTIHQRFTLRPKQNLMPLTLLKSRTRNGGANPRANRMCTRMEPPRAARTLSCCWAYLAAYIRRRLSNSHAYLASLFLNCRERPSAGSQRKPVRAAWPQQEAGGPFCKRRWWR